MNRLGTWIVFLAIALGGCSGGNGDSGPVYWFSVRQSHEYLLVSARNSYELLSGQKQGYLDGATVSALRGYFAAEKIPHYVESAANYTDDCIQRGLVILWGMPSGYGGCWYPAEVSDPATSEMLQYVANLLESIVNG
jgi:hypothetical protein